MSCIMKDKTKQKRAKIKNKPFSNPVCPHCGKHFNDPSSLHCHMKLHSTEEPYTCDLCDYKCKIKKYLTRHVKKAHTKPTGHQCVICGKCFHFQCKLRDHMRVHTGEKPFKCGLCDKAFSSSYSLNTHKLIHTGEKPFQCEYCDYACRDNSTIKRHMERHLGVSKDFPCSICNKNFKKKETLQIHVDEVHFDLDTRKYPCGQCDKVFKTKGTLNIHNNTVHNKANRIKCEICCARVSKNNIQAHMRRHIDVRPYKCSYRPCGRRFKDQGDLKRHLLIHYPDKQHLCTICNRRFPRKSRLNKHTQLHLKGYNVQCDHCAEMFATKAYLSKHIKKAHGPNSKRYICDICNMVTYSRRSIVKHIQYGHGTEKDTKCQICKKDYNKYLVLKEHYLKHHNVKYSLLGKKKEYEVTIKEEPLDEIEEIVEQPEFVYHVDIQKHEIDDNVQTEMFEPSTVNPPSPENYAIDSDTITYSKKVLSEDISRSLIERDNMPEDAFDDFFIGHVLKKPEETIDMPKQIIDEKKKERVEKRLAKLLSEVRIRKECKILEKLRRQYNRRIKMATNCGNKKEQKSIRYYKKPDNNNEATKTLNDANNDDIQTGDDDKNQIPIDKENSRKINKVDKASNKDTVTGNKEICEDKINDQEIGKDRIDDQEIGKDGIDDEEIDDDEVIDDDKDSDYKDSDFESNSDEEANQNGKLKFNTHQCYICFKLFKTKAELKRHCKHHFDICNEKMLKKCPFCGYVTNLQISRHIRLVHKIVLDIPYGRIKERDTQNGSKYVFEIDKDCDLEIIPSISNLNKIASMKIDEKNRDAKNIFLGTTKLVKKAGDWMVEKQAVNINNEYLLPEFTDAEYQALKFVGETYLERIRSLSILAKKKGVKILYPCEGCDKICLTMSALKLHNRKHEANPKRFKPKVWKNKILNGKGGKNNNNKSRKKCVNNNQNIVTNQSNSKINNIRNKKHGKVEIVCKNDENDTDKIANRFADPNPVKNKHKCDKKLIEFYKNNIKGGDIEFWQFLKIFNKMGRENVNDFKDLENRFDFGMHNVINNGQSENLNTVENNTKNIVNNRRIIQKKIGKIKKKGFIRAIMISKKEYLRRIELKNQMRQRLKRTHS